MIINLRILLGLVMVSAVLTTIEVQSSALPITSTQELIRTLKSSIHSIPIELRSVQQSEFLRTGDNELIRGLTRRDRAFVDMLRNVLDNMDVRDREVLNLQIPYRNPGRNIQEVVMLLRDCGFVFHIPGHETR
jgi:hypothetical protein